LDARVVSVGPPVADIGVMSTLEGVVITAFSTLQ
jgi:hypothetical protein